MCIPLGWLRARVMAGTTVRLAPGPSGVALTHAARAQRVSALVGRQLDERDMSRIFPSFPDLSLPDGLAALPCAPFSGSLANGGASEHAAPPAANGDDGGVRSMLTPVPSFKAADGGARGGAPQSLQVRAVRTVLPCASVGRLARRILRCVRAEVRAFMGCAHSEFIAWSSGA